MTTWLRVCETHVLASIGLLVAALVLPAGLATALLPETRK